jgi:photosystem II stability/assembly factor-like uncharacterized protein
MSPKIRKFLQLAVCFLLLTATFFVPDLQANSQSPSDVGLQAFNFSSSEAGWILLDGRVHRTADGGQTWADITPPLADGAQVGDVFFTNSNGWALLTRPSSSGVAYALAVTTNNGQHWNVRDLALFSPTEAWILPASAHLFFLDAKTGWLVIRHATGVNFDLGSLFRTRDGGLTWERLSIPIGEPVVFVNPNWGWTVGGVTGSEAYRSQDGGQTWETAALNSPDLPTALRSADLLQPADGGITRLYRLTDQIAWALVSNGKCQTNGKKTEGTCTMTSSLRRTLDSGQTWQIVPLPSITASTLVSKMDFNAGSMSVTPSIKAANTLTVTGQAFDICEITNLSKMQMWWDASPYTAVNLYIGGSARGCNNVNLSASFLAQLQRQGWKFIPTWVGPQAPCTTYSSRIDSSQAYNQGVAEADAALIAAEQLGLTGPDQSGTIIYYDLEAFNINNDACLNAVRHFMIGWIEEMQEKNVAGVYGSYNSGMTTFADSSPASMGGMDGMVPDAVWLAHWIFPAYNDSATVWDVFNIPNYDIPPNLTYWVNHQRIRQYAGDHTETWGGLSLSMDSNVLDGTVAVRFDGLTNDDFDTAALVASAPFADGRAIEAATTATDDPPLPCAVDQGYQSVWYTFTPSTAGSALVSTAGSNYDTVLAVWTGTRGNLQLAGCSDDFDGPQSTVQFDAAAGTMYYIETAAKTQVDDGLLFISVYLPANDEFSGAQVVSGLPYSHSMDTTETSDSNDDPPVPVCNLTPGRNSVWYIFTPDQSGLLTMDTLSSNYDTYLAVWSGYRGSLKLVACNDDIDAVQTQSSLKAVLTAGTTYHIEVGQYGGKLTTTPANKSAAEAGSLSGGILNFHITAFTTSFADVPSDYWALTWIERLYLAGITGGCSTNPMLYCPEGSVTRAQMAIFLERGIKGSDYVPPDGTGTAFGDVPISYWAVKWIEQLFADGITAGCGDGNFCPENDVTRAQIAIFLLRAEHGSSYVPPLVTETRFTDVPSNYWAASWIEQLAAEGITAGCGNDNYCPEENVTRAEMAVFLVRTFNLP